jgi:hypothetical protein
VRSLRKVISGERKEPLGREKVGFLGKVGLVWGIDETSQHGQGGFPKKGSFL